MNALDTGFVVWRQTYRVGAFEGAPEEAAVCGVHAEVLVEERGEVFLRLGLVHCGFIYICCFFRPLLRELVGKGVGVEAGTVLSGLISCLVVG